MAGDTLHDRSYNEVSIRKDPTWEGKYRIKLRDRLKWREYQAQRKAKFLWWSFWENIEHSGYTEDDAREAIAKEIYGTNIKYLYQ